MKNDCQTYADQDRQTFIEKLGLTYKAKFVPVSQSRNKTEWPESLNWKITLSKGRASLTTDYMQGMAHIPGYVYRSAGTIHEKEVNDRFLETCETGKYSANEGNGGNYLTKPLPTPNLEEILHSLILDAEAIEDTFEDWASNYGYDTDSRKAEAVYHACVQTGILLTQLIGREAIDQLRTLYQDY